MNIIKQIYYKCCRVIGAIDMIPRKIKWLIQRGRRGFGDCDLWNFDYYLSDVISNGVKELKEIKVGHPTELSKKGWDKILDKIIKTFSTAKKIIDFDYYYVENKNFTDKKYKELKERYKKYNKKFQESKVHIMTKKEVTEYEAGWKLFRDNFMDLWD